MTFHKHNVLFSSETHTDTFRLTHSFFLTVDNRMCMYNMYIYPWCSILQEEESWSPKFRRECSGRWHDQTSTTPKETQSHLCPEETALFYCRIPHHRVTSGLPNHMNPDKNTYSKTFNCNSRNLLKYTSMQMQAHAFQRICLRHLQTKQKMLHRVTKSQPITTYFMFN